MKRISFKILTVLMATVLIFGAFSVFLFAEDGSTQGRDVYAEIDTVYGGRKGIITLTFDDGRIETATLVNELLEKYELKGTLMLIANRVANYYDFWKDLFAEGNLVPQNHSMSHVGMRADVSGEADNLNAETFQKEIIDSKTLLEEAFPEYDMITYAVPNGRWESSAAEVALGEYYMIRYSYGGLQNINPGYEFNKNGNWSALKCISINTQTKPGQIADLKAQVEQAAEGAWMCTLAHKVGDMSDYELSRSEAEELFAYISEYEKNGLVWVTDTASATKYVRERQNATVSAKKYGDVINVSATLADKSVDGLTLDPEIFDYPLTVKVELDSSFEQAYYFVGEAQKQAQIFTEGGKRYARIEIVPNGEQVVLCSDPTDINLATAELSVKIANAEDVLEKAKKKLNGKDYANLESIIAEAYQLKQSYTDKSELDTMILALDEEMEKVSAILRSVDTWSVGAKQTIFDTVENAKVIHLNSNGTYTMSSSGAGKTFTLYQTVDGVKTEIASWTEGTAYARLSEKNPCVVFILDDDVTFTGTSSWYATNILFDLGGNDIKFTSASASPIILKNGASVEFRGEGNIVWATTGYYMVQGDNTNGVLTLNGKVTVDAQNPNGKIIFYLNGGIYVYGTLTINDNFRAAENGSVFFTQGYRSSAKEVKGFVKIVDATVNANNHNGASLFYSKGVSGTYNGATYTAIPEFTVTGSTLNVRCPLITNLWGSDSIDGNYADTKEHLLENAVNANRFNLINSKVNADLYYDATITNANRVTLIYPKGYTEINVTDSVIDSKQGRIITVLNGSSVNLNLDNSVFVANTSAADTDALKSSMNWSNASILRANVIRVIEGASGTATIDNCTVKCEYRAFEGATKDASKESFFATITNTNINMNPSRDGNTVVFVRFNAIVDNCKIDCGESSLSYVVLPYNPDTNCGVLLKSGVVLYNLTSSSFDKDTASNTYVKTVDEQKALAETNSSYYGTYASTNCVTVENGTCFCKIDSDVTVSGRYSYRLVKNDGSDSIGFVPLYNVTFYTDFMMHFYVPTSANVKEIELAGVKYKNFSNLEIKEVDGQPYYKVSKRVGLTSAAKKMTFSLTVIGEDNVETSNSWTVSVVDHLYCLSRDDSMSKVTKTIACDVLSYIRAAYEYASVSAAEIERINSYIGTGYDEANAPDMSMTAANDVDGLYAATIELNSHPSFIFWISDSYNASDFVFTADGKTLNSEIFVDKDGYTCIRVNMYAYQMAYTVHYSINGTDVSGEFNIKAYYDFAKTLSDSGAKNLVLRLWKYAQSADEYKNEVEAQAK